MKFRLKKFPYLEQLDGSDCGFACLRIISKHYGIEIPTNHKAFSENNLTKQGLTFLDLKKVSIDIGFNPLFVELNFTDVLNNVIFPAIFLWENNHFVVVYKITNQKVYVSDPAIGRVVYSKNEFLKNWSINDIGMVVLLEPTKRLYLNSKIEKEKRLKSFKILVNHLLNYKRQIYIIAVILLLSSIIEFIFPFFTQKIIDNGVKNKNIPFLYLILFAQVLLFISKIINEFYRSWLFVHISSRVSLQLISDFLVKLMNLPIKFFFSKSTGDLLERINDYKRIENFLTNDLIKSIFAFFSIIVFSLILLNYNVIIFLIFILGNILQLIWVFTYLNKIKEIDKKKFKLLSKEQNKNLEILTGMQEIKLNNLEFQKKNEWEKIQYELFKNNIDNLQENQKYESYRFIIFFTSIFLTFYSALLVINGILTIGSMMAIVLVIGAVNVPISQMINFVLSYQLLKVRISRIDEINELSEEFKENKKKLKFNNGSLKFKNLQFSYDKQINVLNNINLTINEGTTTAIVGLSGSGKTTLIKLLLKFYKPSKGEIFLGSENIENIDDQKWRNRCGVIFQDSFIFSNSIGFNIALEENYDINKLMFAAEKANIKSFIENLQLKDKTIIGKEGIAISQGQTQRVLIARAIYKNPDYLFFDEATNSLDAENEKIIVENIDSFFKNKTKIIIAHRLNTVVNADQIVVLEKGFIVEKGSHNELINLKGKYYNLVKNQLELNNLNELK